MKPDIDKYYNIEQAALFKAGIDPRTCCNRIEKAVERRVKGYQTAEDYFYNLQDRVQLGKWGKPEKNDVYIHSGGTLDAPVPYKNFITGRDLLEWCEQEEPIKQSGRGKPEIHPKTENTYMKLIASLLKLVMCYENKQPKPTDFKNRNILKKDGKISFHALNELLQAIDTDTPRRADEIMSRSLNED